MKKISNIFLMLSIIVLSINACKQKENFNKPTILTTAGTDAVGPYLTKDNNGNPVVCWAEKIDSLYQLKYAVYNPIAKEFGASVTVHGSAGMSISPESMGKVAFKSDNTVIAVFAKSFTEEKNPFAGAIYYAASTDHGKTWSVPQFLHSDTTRSVGRSFFDLTRLEDGEVAAIWLDGRFGKTIKGSGLFYAKTNNDQKFGQDTCLYKGTCECCRTDILQDENGVIHIAYRSILFPSSHLGKQVRDMVYIFSKDNGATFSPPKIISKDNWAIEGCPHTGPSLAIVNKSVNAVWFTAGGQSGIYYTSAATMEDGFQNRHLVTSSGKHPQMISLTNGNLAMVCEEVLQSQEKAKDHTMANMAMSHTQTGGSKIVLRLLDNKGNQVKTIDITDGKNADHHAVINIVGNDLMLAWIREEKGHSSIYYTTVRVD